MIQEIFVDCTFLYCEDLGRKGTKMSELTFYVAKDRCSGCGECWEALPSIFKENEEGVAEVESTDIKDRTQLDRIIKNCPPKAIKWKK